MRHTIVFAAFLFLFACDLGTTPGVNECANDTIERDGRCHLPLWESVSATAANSTCERLDGELITALTHDDIEFIMGLTQGRTAWIGCGDGAVCNNLPTGHCPYIDEDGEIQSQSCYPQSDPTRYPRSYVCRLNQ